MKSDRFDLAYDVQGGILRYKINLFDTHSAPISMAIDRAREAVDPEEAELVTVRWGRDS